LEKGKKANTPKRPVLEDSGPEFSLPIEMPGPCSEA
jgi:hypothetical protein